MMYPSAPRTRLFNIQSMCWEQELILATLVALGVSLGEDVISFEFKSGQLDAFVY